MTAADLGDVWLWKFAIRVSSRTKHGANQDGSDGPCEPNCLKCQADELIKATRPKMK